MGELQVLEFPLYFETYPPFNRNKTRSDMKWIQISTSTFRTTIIEP